MGVGAWKAGRFSWACSGGQTDPGVGKGSARKVSGDTKAQNCPFCFCLHRALAPLLAIPPPASCFGCWHPHLSHGLQPWIFFFYQLLPRTTPLRWSWLSLAPPRRVRVGLGTRRHRRVTARNETPAPPPFWLLKAPALSLRGCPLWTAMEE